MPVPNLAVAFHLTFFLGSAYGDGIPMLQYSEPVVKAAIDDVKVCHCGVACSPLGSLTLTCDGDLG
jgi:hypothetical protein